MNESATNCPFNIKRGISNDIAIEHLLKNGKRQTVLVILMFPWHTLQESTQKEHIEFVKRHFSQVEFCIEWVK